MAYIVMALYSYGPLGRDEAILYSYGLQPLLARSRLRVNLKSFLPWLTAPSAWCLTDQVLSRRGFVDPPRTGRLSSLVQRLHLPRLKVHVWQRVARRTY